VIVALKYIENNTFDNIYLFWESILNQRYYFVFLITNTHTRTNIVWRQKKNPRNGVPEYNIYCFVWTWIELTSHFSSRVAHGRTILLLYRHERTISCVTQIIKQLVYQNITFNIVLPKNSNDIIVKCTFVIRIIYKYTSIENFRSGYLNNLFLNV